jgi:hypothetical protein
VSNSNNLGKELARLRKELDEIKAKDRRFHFVIVDKTSTEQERIDTLLAAGTMKKGDAYQVIDVPWVISELKGSLEIPEGRATDPYAEPPLPPPETTPWKEEREREERWAKHVREIERRGERFGYEKPGTDGIY